MLRSRLMRQAFFVLAAVLAACPAFAHSGDGLSGGFAGGFAHPIFGPDHVIAMVAVGLWGAFLGAPAIWLLPIVFPLVMAFGGVLGILGVPLPGVEIGIAMSAVVLGLMVALAARPPLWVAATPTAPSFRPAPMRLPFRSASWWRPDCCTSPASASVCWHAGPPDGLRCARRAGRSRWPASPS